MRLYSMLCLLLLAPTLARAGNPEASALPALASVQFEGYQGPGGSSILRLAFPQLPPQRLPPLSLEDARAVVAELEKLYPLPKPKPPRASEVLSLGGMGTYAPTMLVLDDKSLEALEKRVRDDFIDTFTQPAALPAQTGPLSHSNWFKALRASPHYMPEGLKHAAVELFTSPQFAFSAAFALFCYAGAWVAPELFVSKGAAGLVTAALLIRFTYTEILNTVQAFLTLYREAEAATTEEALQQASSHFANALTGVGLRLIVVLAGAKLSSKLPEGPPGGIWGRVAPPRGSFASSASTSGASASVLNRYFSQPASAPASVQPGATTAPGSFVGGRLVADARSVSFVVVLAATQAEAHAAARKAARTTGACRDEDNKGSAHGHHIATDKNPLSTDHGGPWTPQFEFLFKKVGLTLNDKANIVNLIDHQGPHPEAYHKEVYKRLSEVFRQCTTLDDCKIKFLQALDDLAADICKEGSYLNKLATKKP